MNPHYTIKLCDGKYTVINEYGRALKFLRHGEPWPPADESFGHASVIKAMADRIEELEVAIKAVLDGELDERGVRGCKALGIAHYAESAWTVPLREWEGTLRNVLEQRS